MLREMYDIGEVIIEKRDINVEEQFVDKAKLKKTKIVLCITFKIDEEGINYIGIQPEQFDVDNIMRYLYKSGSSRGTDILPSSLIAQSEVKTFENKILLWFKNNRGYNDFFEKIYSALERDKDKIESELSIKYEDIPKEEKQNVLLTLKFENNGTKYLGDYPIFRKVLLDSSKERYYYLSSMGTSLGEGTCYLCGEEKEVYGFVLPAFGFSFSTADKPGFVVNFKKDEIWKEIPICEDCAVKLEVGKKYLDERLSFKFYGSRYYAIPQVLIPEKSKDILSEIMDIIEQYDKKDYTEGLISDEDEMTEIAMEKGNILKMIFVFYTQKGGGKYIDIVKYIENVLPSHLRRIYDTENTMRLKYSEDFVKKIFGEKAEGNFVDFRRGVLKKEKSGRNNWYVAFGRMFFTGTKELLEYVGNILSGKPIDRRYLISKFMESFRKEFQNKNDYGFKLRVVESMMIYDFLKEMELIRGEVMTEEKEAKIKISEEKIEKFFEERKSTFNSDEAKAAFLVGALVGDVLYVQRTERNVGYGDEPFRTKLYGLNIDEKKLRKIFKEAVEKLSEYKRGTKLEAIAADYLTRAGNGWKLSREDVSYYFSLGMVLGSAIFWEKKENGGEENGSE